MGLQQPGGGPGREAGQVLSQLDWRRFPVSAALGGLILLGFLVEVLLGSGLRGSESAEVLTRLGAVRGDLVFRRGEVWRLLCAPFLHMGPVHLLLNGVGFLQLAPLVEAVYGRWRLLAAWFLTGLGGTLASALFTPLPSVGASGAILGLCGLLLGSAWVGPEPLRGELRRHLARPLLVGVGLTFALGIGIQVLWRPLVDNLGHLGGLMSGVLLSLCFRRPQAPEGRPVTLLAGVLAGLFLAALGGMIKDGGRAAPRAQDEQAELLLEAARARPTGSLARVALPQLCTWLMQLEQDADADWATETWRLLAPDDPQAQNARAWFLLTRPDVARRNPQVAQRLAAEAVATLEREQARPLELAPVLDTLAAALRALGETERARELERRVVAGCQAALAGGLGPEQAGPIHQLLTESAERLGERELAERALAAWIAALPEDPAARRALARRLLDLPGAGPAWAGAALAQARLAERLSRSGPAGETALAQKEAGRAQALAQQARRRLTAAATPGTAR